MLSSTFFFFFSSWNWNMPWNSTYFLSSQIWFSYLLSKEKNILLWSVMGGTFCFISKIGLQFKYILLRDEKIHKLLLKIVGPVYCSRDSQTTFSQKKNFKTGSYNTIYTFKNYFVTVFSVISFQFSVFNNKRYPNRL